MRRGERKTTRTELPLVTRMMIVVMRHHRKASYQEIADYLHLKVNTVKTIWQRCVARVGNTSDLVALCENVGTLPRSGRPRNNERVAREVGGEEMEVLDEDVEVEIEVGMGEGRRESEDRGDVSEEVAGDKGDMRGTQEGIGEAMQTETQSGISTILVRTKASILEQLRNSGGLSTQRPITVNPNPPQIFQAPVIHTHPIPQPTQLQLAPQPLPAAPSNLVLQIPAQSRAIQPRLSPPHPIPPRKLAIARAYFPFQQVQSQMTRFGLVEQLQEAASATT